MTEDSIRILQSCAKFVRGIRIESIQDSCVTLASASLNDGVTVQILFKEIVFTQEDIFRLFEFIAVGIDESFREPEVFSVDQVLREACERFSGIVKSASAN